MNPFIISGFSGGEYFCNRKEELKALKNAFDNGRNVTLFSLRRMGKSALVKFLFEKLEQKADCIYVDILPAMNFSELTGVTVNAVTEYLGTSVKDYFSKIAALVKSIGAALSFDELSGKPKIHFGIGGIKEQSKSFEEIITFLESKKNRTLLVFDEFQQIRNFPETNTEAVMRTIFQKCKKITFMYL